MYGKEIFAPSGTIKLEGSSFNAYFQGYSNFSDPDCRGVALTNFSFVTSGLISGPEGT